MSRPSSPRALRHPRSCAPCGSTSASNCCPRARPPPPSAQPSSARTIPSRKRCWHVAEIVIVPDATAAGELVAEEIARLVRADPEAVLGLATGSTPLPVYEALPSRLQGVDVSRVRGFALDEYVGLDPRHPETYRNVITREVVEPLGLTPELIHTPNGSPDGIEHAGDDYEAAMRDAGGVELQILGIGTGGHIGFNEPGSSFASQTRVKTLTAQTRSD